MPPGTYRHKGLKSIKVLNQNGIGVMRISVNTKVDIESDAVLVASSIIFVIHLLFLLLSFYYFSNPLFPLAHSVVTISNCRKDMVAGPPASNTIKGYTV